MRPRGDSRCSCDRTRCREELERCSFVKSQLSGLWDSPPRIKRKNLIFGGSGTYRSENCLRSCFLLCYTPRHCGSSCHFSHLIKVDYFVVMVLFHSGSSSTAHICST